MHESLRPYATLRQIMKEQDVDQAYLAAKLGQCRSYVETRINARHDCGWSEKDMYMIMDFLHIPYERLHEVFPPKGVAIQPKPQDAKRTRKAIILDVDESILARLIEGAV